MPKYLVTQALSGAGGTKFSELSAWAYEGQPQVNVSMNFVNTQKYSGVSTNWYGLGLYGSTTAPGQYFYRLKIAVIGEGTVSMTFPYSIAATATDFTPLWFPSGLFSSFSITATATLGYVFDHWAIQTPDGLSYSSNANTSVNYANSVTDSSILYAVFVPDSLPSISTYRPCTYAWSLENLRTNTYRDYTSIPLVTLASSWQAATTGSYTYYGNTLKQTKLFGALYNWSAVNDVRGLAPVGCRIPTAADPPALSSDWDVLINCLGGTSSAGNRMKEDVTQILWNVNNTGADNSSGFNARGGGYRTSEGSYLDSTVSGYWWSSTEDPTDPTQALFKTIDSLGSSVYSQRITPTDNLGGCTNGSLNSFTVSPNNSTSLSFSWTFSPSNLNRVTIETSTSVSGPWVTLSDGTGVSPRTVVTTPPTSGTVKFYRATGHTEPYWPLPPGFFYELNTTVTFPVTSGVNFSFTSAAGQSWQVGQNINIIADFSLTGTLVSSITNAFTFTINSYTNASNISGARSLPWSVSIGPSYTGSSTTAITFPPTLGSNLTLTINGVISGVAPGDTVSVSFYRQVTGTVAAYSTGGSSLTVTPVLTDSRAGSFNTGWKLSHAADPPCGQISKQYPGNVGGKNAGMSVRYVMPVSTIGTQTWMATNLDVTQYRNGDSILQITNATAWAAATTGAWCWYGFNYASYGTVYGKLYNNYAITDPRGLAPLGWHIPSDYEWQKLSTYIGGSSNGYKLKEIGTTHWTTPNTGATDAYGFDSIPSGGISAAGAFSNIGTNALYWTSTYWPVDLTPNIGWTGYSLAYNTTTLSKGVIINPTAGAAVRCVKDTEGSIPFTIFFRTTATVNFYCRVLLTNTDTGEWKILENLEDGLYLTREYYLIPGQYTLKITHVSSIDGSLTYQFCDINASTQISGNPNLTGEVSVPFNATVGPGYSLGLGPAGANIPICGV